MGACPITGRKKIKMKTNKIKYLVVNIYEVAGKTIFTGSAAKTKKAAKKESNYSFPIRVWIDEKTNQGWFDFNEDACNCWAGMESYDIWEGEFELKPREEETEEE